MPVPFRQVHNLEGVFRKIITGQYALPLQTIFFGYHLPAFNDNLFARPSTSLAATPFPI
jgi:hypothetical protein